MNRCKTCKHWRGIESWVFGKDKREEDARGRRMCHAVSNQRKPERPGQLAAAVCLDEGIDGELLTAPEFGCVMWEGPRDE